MEETMISRREALKKVGAAAVAAAAGMSGIAAMAAPALQSITASLRGKCFPFCREWLILLLP